MESESAKILKELREELFSEVVWYEFQIEQKDYSDLSLQELQDRVQFIYDKIELIDNEFRS